MPGLRHEGHALRAADVQPDVQDVHGPGRGLGVGGVPAPGDGAGHLREFPQRPAVDAAEGAVRHRPDRQGVPQRDHPGELHLPHARVRADGDAVLRRAGHRHALVRVLERAADELAQVARPGAGAAGVPSAHEGRARPLRARRVRRDLRLRWHARLPGDRGRPQPRRLRPLAPPGILRQEARVLRSAEQQALPAVRRRDVGRRRPHDARRARQRLSRGDPSRAKTRDAPCSGCIRRSRRSRPASFRW